MFDPSLTPHLTKQNYTPARLIDGVAFLDLKTFVDDSGLFLELGRLAQGFLKTIPKFEIKQLNYSQILPGTIKATHIHKKQDDLWFVPPTDRLLIGLRDIRKKSKTYDLTMRIVLGAGAARLLFIPAGVAHGASNLWQSPATLIYCVNQHFSPDPKQCDEYRLPSDFFGKDFWKITAG